MSSQSLPFQPEPFQATRPLQVLIVEDVESMRGLLEVVVNGIQGLSVSGLAANGWEARIELSRRRPDFILLDEILPGESELDLLREFHSLEVPVILITGIQQPTHDCPPLALGRIVKPGWKTLETDRKRFENEVFLLIKKAHSIG